jgi:hypothetical protein
VAALTSAKAMTVQQRHGHFFDVPPDERPCVRKWLNENGIGRRNPMWPYVPMETAATTINAAASRTVALSVVKDDEGAERAIEEPYPMPVLLYIADTKEAAMFKTRWG